MLIPKQISLQRLKSSQWEELPTAIIRADQNGTHYKSESPGFSLFAITARKTEKMPQNITSQASNENSKPVSEIKQEAAPIQPPKPEPEKEKSQIIPVIKSEDRSSVLAIIIALIVIAATIFAFSKRTKNPKS